MKYLSLAILGFSLLASGHSIANEQDLMEMQRQLNAETVSKPFDAGEAAKIDAYVAEAMKKDLKPPVVKTPNYWRSGYTCRDSYRYGGYRSYRNCRHYRAYYGRFW